MAQLVPGKEFERKFLARVDRLPKLPLERAQHIEQGYLALSPNQIRIRLRNGAYIVELKGADNIEVTLCKPSREQGDMLLHSIATKTASIIVKERHEVPAGFDNLAWEIDFFRGENAPLVVVEIEMPTLDFPLKKRPLPKWVGKEVTKDVRFKNKNLAVRPFASWPKSEQKKVLKWMGC